MSTTLVFLEHYTQDFTLDTISDKDIMKFLIDNADKDEIKEPKEHFLFKDGMHIEDIIEEYLENHIHPVPDYTEEELEKTDFTKSVSVTLTLELPIDLCEDYGSCGASFWDQGDCEEKDHDKFMKYIEKYVKELNLQKGEYADEDLGDDCLYQDGDFVPVADMIQWNYLSHLYTEFIEEKEKEKKEKCEHFLLPFYEAYTHNFTLQTFKDLAEYTETNYDSKRIMKYLYDISGNPTITEQQDAWTLTEKYSIGSILVGFLDKVVVPNLPNYTNKQLNQTDFTKSVEIIFHLEMKVDMGKDSRYTDNNSGFWDMGGCEEEEEFMEYLIEKYEEEAEGDEAVEEYLGNDCINDRDDPLRVEYADIADIIQWRFLQEKYAEFLEEQEKNENS